MKSIENTNALYRKTIYEYLNDPIGKETWDYLDMESISDIDSAMRIIFIHGACIDFANVISDVTGWSIYEVQWGKSFPDDNDDCELLEGVHRVIKHPSGRYFDASGWTDMNTVLKTFEAENSTYKWMDEVDYGGTVFNVDYGLIKKSAISIVPDGILNSFFLNHQHDDCLSF